jgi:hypothetical protein
MIVHLQPLVYVIDNDTYQKHEGILPILPYPVKRIALHIQCLVQEFP